MIAILSTTRGVGFGAEVVLIELLHSWNKNYQQLLIIAPPESKVLRMASETGHSTLELKSRKDTFIKNAWAAERIISNISKCDLIHAWSARSFELAWRIGQKLEIPACGTQHDHPNAIYIRFFRRKLMNISANHFAKLICVSSAVQVANKKAGYKCAMEVIYNGVNEIKVSRERADVVTIGFLGMYSKWKGFKIVSEWIERTSQNNIRWFLYGDVNNELKEKSYLLADMNPATLCLKGKKPPSVIFSEIDVLLLASTHFEAFGMVLIEAASAGIPVIASSLGGAPEVVIDNETGFLFDPDHPEVGLENLIKLSADRELRLDMGGKARAHYEKNFKAEHMADAYHNTWTELIVDSGKESSVLPARQD